MRIIVVAVGRLRPPFADDVEHYRRLLSRYARLELLEVREDEQVARRLPERAFVSLLDARGEAPDSVQFSEFLEARRQSGLDLCFVVGGPFGLELERAQHRLSLGTLTDAGARGLLAIPGLASLEKLDIHHHYVSSALVERLEALGIQVDASDPREAEDVGDDELYRFVAHSE